MKTTLPTLEEVQSCYNLHHIASSKGYVSRKSGPFVEREYHGRFGDGFVVASPRWDTTQFHYVHYYTIRK